MKKNDRITLSHGSGGKLTHQLIKEIFLKYLKNPALNKLQDSALLNLSSKRVAFTTDSFVIQPIFFPGGDIGHIAVAGTVNDIAVLGAEPYALACGFILEEGLAVTDFERILSSMQQTCVEADVSIVTGDTKVVEKGSLGGCVINTSGIGRKTASLEENLEVVKQFRRGFKARWILDSNLNAGDKIILSGTIGDHGLAVLSAQEGLTFGSDIKSDVKPLNRIIQRLLGEVGGIVAMKDPTRGGLADALNEFSEKSQVGVLVHEGRIPVRADVQAACEMLGLDPLEIGNEGKVVIGVVNKKADETLRLLRATEEGKEAEIIGEATKGFKGVAMQTLVGGKRIISRPVGDPVPRIC